MKAFSPPILPQGLLNKLLTNQIPGGPIGGQVFTAEGNGAASFQYGELANVLDMGVKGDGTTNDAPQIQVLFNAFRGTGIGLFFPRVMRDGVTRTRYLLETVINPTSNLRVVLDDGVVIDANIPGATTLDCPFVYQFGPLATSSTLVNGTAVEFSDRIPVVSTAGITPGPADDPNTTWVAVFDGVNGIRGGIYPVIAIPAPGVLQVNRPILWPFSSATGDTVSIYNGIGPDGVTKCPALTNFTIESPGEAIFEGQCVAYMNLVGAQNCGIRGLRGRAGGSGTGVASDAGFAFQIGYRNWQAFLYLDGHGGNISNKSIPLVAQEEFLSYRVTANEGGSAGTNIGVQDCVNCDFYHTISMGGLNGCVLATETAAVSGIQSNRWVRFFGLSIVNPIAEALSLGVGASFNSFVGLFIARAGGIAISLNDGGNITPVEQNSFVDYSIENSGAGIHALNHAIRNNFTNGRIKDSTTTDIIIDAGAAGNAFERTVVDNAVVAGAHIIVNDDAHFEDLKGIYTQNSSIGLEVAAACTVIVRDYKMTLPPASDAFYVPAGVLDVAHGAAGGSNAGTTGIQTNGGTARVGPHNDFTGLGASFLNSAGFFSRSGNGGGAAVVITGAAPVAVPWPDLKTTDRVVLILRTPTFAGAQTLVFPTYTPGTGFSVTGFAGDTSTYDYVVE